MGAYWRKYGTYDIRYAGETTLRNSLSQLFYKINVFKNFAKFTGKQPYQRLFLGFENFLRSTFYGTPPSDCFCTLVINFLKCLIKFSTVVPRNSYFEMLCKISW